MLVRFLKYNSCDWQPLAIRGKVIDRVGSFKLLGLIISEDLKRAADCNVVNKKCNKRLYALRILKKCGVQVDKLSKVYCSLIYSVTEYACSVLANISKYLVTALESIQTHALSIIYRLISYHNALLLSGLSSLEECRSLACTDFISKIKPSNPVKYGHSLH